MSDYVDKCKNVILDVQNLLKEKKEWVERYSNYSELMDANKKIIQDKKKLFNEWAPLHVYMTITGAKGKMDFSLRYRGQEVGNLIVDKQDNVSISTSQTFNKSNKRDFECDIELDKNAWASQKAASFRQHFRNNRPRTTKAKSRNEEHRVESLLLTEFSKKKKENKRLFNIQPIKIANLARFQMPTPLKASKAQKIEYAGCRGGGIDILCRIGTGKGTKLCILEVKDENNSNETHKKTVLQGLAYATFIRELLRSESGEKWWKIFGFNGNLPEKLDLYVASAMPDKNDDETAFAGKSIKIEGSKDVFHLHYLSFKEENNALAYIKTSLKQCIVGTQD